MAERRASARDESGAVAILVAVVSLALFVLAAIVVDLGMARDIRRESQNAADASALAGANALFPTSTCRSPVGGAPPCLTDAVSAVKSYATTNFGVPTAAWSTCTDPGRPSTYVTQTSPCISVDSTTKPRYVRVRIPGRSMTTGFGSLAGTRTITISSDARAKVVESVVQECALCFLGAIDAGNADFTVENGSIHVNGNLSSGPNAAWTASGGGQINVAGTASGGTYSPNWRPAAAITDPYATMAMPDTTGLTTKTDPCAAAPSGGPGVYTAEEIPKTTCTLRPGLYVISGPWTMKNNSLLAGTGVTLYVRAGGSLDFKNGEVSLVAPTSGTLKDKAIIYERTNSTNLGLQGNGETSITGMVYAPSSKLDFNGNSGFGFAGGPIVANGVVKANGNKSFVTVKDPMSATLPPLPGGVSLDQ